MVVILCLIHQKSKLKQKTQISFSHQIASPWHTLVVFRHANNLCYCEPAQKISATLFEVLHWNNPSSYNWLFHIHFRSVRVIGGAVKSLWMRSLLWGNKCKQCYQAGCRRSCPSPKPGPLSRCYFWILNAQTLFLCGSRILKKCTDKHRWCVCFTDTLNFRWRI